MNKILLIGLGPHAKRIYFPIMQKWGKDFNAELECAVDLESKKEDIQNYLKDKGVNLSTYYLPDKEVNYNKLSDSIKKKMDQIVEDHNIKGVIIATEPLVHAQYSKWALEKELHILLDKPISLKKNVSTDLRAAKSILRQYEGLRKKYKKARNRGKDIRFSIMAQRRFHPAFQLMKKLISEVYIKTDCPVTSVQSFHCDGQWRMPSEIVDQIYHPYCQGYGKVSHSGYHSIDIMPWLMEAAEDSQKEIDEVDIYTNFVRPRDFMSQLPLDRYKEMFANFDKYNKYTEEELNEKMIGFGEIDAFNSFAFKHDEKVITLGSNNLAHNGFAQRSWPTAENKDLYKGNGRIRHEMHTIEQGPFQSITYLSYQGEEVDPKKQDGIYEFGGEYHLDIHVFRNDKMFPEWKNHRHYSIKDLSTNLMEGKSRGHQEDARRMCVEEFLQCIDGKDINLTSELTDHRRAAVLSTGIYQSAIFKRQNKNPMITLNFKK